MQEPYVIGIDIGTGSTKGGAVALSGAVLASAQAFYATTQNPPNFSEQDPEAIWEAFVKTVQKIVTEMTRPPLAVSLSSCMHSLMLMDATGARLTQNITWADRRSAAIAAALRQTLEGKSIYKATGTPLHAMSPLCKLRWFYEQQHGLFKNMTKAISIKEYIWYKIFRVYEVDYSIASATGLFDLEQLQWHGPALAFCGIEPARLSKPVSTRFVRTNIDTTIASLLNLPGNTPFCIGASDGCLANVGSDALRAGTAAVTIGTSGAVRMASATPVTIYPEMIFNYRLDEASFICGGAVNNGGNIVQWLLHQFLENPSSEPEAYATLFELAAGAPAGCDGLICLPYLHGERAPRWDEKACGIFFGLRPHHSKAYFIRAALEGVCLGLYAVLKKLEAAAGSIQTLHVSGGMVHSRIWMQMLADVTGKKVCLVHTDDASAVGAALLGFAALGLTTGYTTGTQNIKTVIEPDKTNHTLYEGQFVIFEELYVALKPVMHRTQS